MGNRPKGRLLPSSLSRSRQYGALSSRGKILYPLMNSNADDQGRLPGDPETLKWTVCPNVSEIAAEIVPELLAEMQRGGLILVYDDGPTPVIQMAQWWSDQSALQWAYPSEFAPHQTWDDRLRFRAKNRVITINWTGVTDGAADTPLAQLEEAITKPGCLAIALGKALGRRQLQGTRDKVQEQEYPPYPPNTQAPPAQRPHAGHGKGKEKKEAPHGRVRQRRLAADPQAPRLPWKRISGDD